MNDWAEFGLLMFLIVSSGIVGWGANEIYQIYFEDKPLGRDYNGIYIYDSENWSTALDVAKSRDGRGDWVCINVAFEMTPERAYRTCVHECTHKAFSEIYAEECEQHPSDCFAEIWGTNTEKENLNSKDES